MLGSSGRYQCWECGAIKTSILGSADMFCVRQHQHCKLDLKLTLLTYMNVSKLVFDWLGQAVRVSGTRMHRGKSCDWKCCMLLEIFQFEFAPSWLACTKATGSCFAFWLVATKATCTIGYKSKVWRDPEGFDAIKNWHFISTTISASFSLPHSASTILVLARCKVEEDRRDLGIKGSRRIGKDACHMWAKHSSSFVRCGHCRHVRGQVCRPSLFAGGIAAFNVLSSAPHENKSIDFLLLLSLKDVACLIAESSLGTAFCHFRFCTP